jgi:hypothetical protein
MINVFVTYFKIDPLSNIFVEEMRKIRAKVRIADLRAEKKSTVYEAEVAKHSVAMVSKTESCPLS